MAMVNDQAPRQACRGGHICSVRGPRGNPIAGVPLYETASHNSDSVSVGSDPSKHRGDLFAPRQARRLPDDGSLTVQDDDGGRPHDAELPDQVQVGLGIDVDVGDVVESCSHVAQQSARRAARAAERTGELHQGRTRPERGAELGGSQNVAAMASTKACVHELQRTGD